MKTRQTKLIEYVSIHGKTKVDTLAEVLQTSQVTIRKDLDFLSAKGILKRERGFAILNDPNDINYRLAFHYEEKFRIAQSAMLEIEDGETIIIEAGSTCAIFAEAVAKSNRRITIITNSMHIAGFIKDYPNINIILLGGNLQNQTQALVGPITKNNVSAFHVDKIFIGVDGYSREHGFTGNDLIRSDTLKSMIDSANKVYVLTESNKFKRKNSMPFLQFDSVYKIITDTNLEQDEVEFLQAQNITIKLA